MRITLDLQSGQELVEALTRALKEAETKPQPSEETYINVPLQLSVQFALATMELPEEIQDAFKVDLPDAARAAIIKKGKHVEVGVKKGEPAPVVSPVVPPR